MPRDVRRPPSWSGLNESPPEKEGKSGYRAGGAHVRRVASMKALPKRKGNSKSWKVGKSTSWASMKALPKRKGNLQVQDSFWRSFIGLNESPPEKEGKCGQGEEHGKSLASLNESPPEKEGKLA